MGRRGIVWRRGYYTITKGGPLLEGDVIYCDCCGTETLAQIVGENLVIKDRRHGRRHVAIIPISALLDILESKGDNSYIDQAAKLAVKT